MGRSGKRHLKTAGILAGIFVMAAGSLWYFFSTRSNSMEILPNSVMIADGTVLAAGMTETGTDTAVFAIDFLKDTSLCVEEVYLSEKDTVAAGERCIKFTEDSIDRARAELESAVQNTDLAYRSMVISNGESILQAKYTYDTAVLEADHAPQVYQDTLTQLEMQLVRAEKDYQKAQEAFSAYELAVKNNTFYEDYQIEALKKAYDDAYDLFASRREYWQVTTEELAALADSCGDVRAGQDDRQWIVRTAALLQEEMTETKEEYEQARQNYQREIEGAELKLQTLLNQLQRAQQRYTAAQIERQKGGLHAKSLYELAAAKGQTAESDYNVCLISLADALERQRDARDEALENRTRFEQLAGDGYLYTERGGTVFAVYVEEGQTLAGGDTILSYASPEEIIVPVSVAEKDAAKLSAGEKAAVTIADCGSFDGVIKSIQPAGSAHSAVVVSLEGNVSTVGSGRTAMVVFGASAQDSGTGNGTIVPVSQMYDVDITAKTEDGHAEYLKVAEVYVTAGQHINAGDPVCEFTPDSVEKVRKTLTRAHTKALAAFMKTQTAYHTGVLEAGLSHNESMLGMVLAQAVYENTIAGLNSGMTAKMLETEQLLQDIYQLQCSLTEDGYLEQKAEIVNAYDKARKQTENARERFVTSQVEAAQAFQAAKASYEDFFGHFEKSNQQIADMMEEVYTIQDEILQSQQLLEKELLSAEQARGRSQMEGETGYARYTGILREHETALELAQANLDEAAQRLDDFNRLIGDGTICAAGGGLVTAVGCRRGDLLADMGKLVSYVEDVQ